MIKPRTNTYEAKIQELQKERDEEAKKLQGAIQEKESVLAEIGRQIERKSRLNREIEELGGQIQKASEEVRKLSEQHLSLLAKSKSELEKERKAIEGARREMELEVENMENVKVYLSDLYGKIASYISTAKETVEWVNNYMEETGLPFRFRAPNGKIIEVDMDNFNKQMKI